MAPEKKYRICPLCEATCGLELKVDGRDVLEVRGDNQDVFSKGYVCPKGVAIKELDADPDRLRTPMIREGDTWREASWDEAFKLIEAKLGPIREEYGKNAVGIYMGNPSVHSTALSIYGQVLLRAMGTHNRFSAGTVDQVPKQLSSALMFGTGLSIPIPDLNRCNYLLIMGANPLVSNGSLMTAPDIAKRIKGIGERGGKVVVLDPLLTKTAQAANEHFCIVPGTDAFFLFAVIHTLFEEGLTKPGRLAELATGLEDVEALAKTFSPETVAEKCGIPAEVTRRIAREFAAASGAAIHARIGTCTQEFGTLSSWLPDVIHFLTGNLDEAGGALFALAACGAVNTKGAPGVGKGHRMGRSKSRVSGHAENFGEFPAACLAEEIETSGEGQIRAMITVAGNPVLSNPNGTRLAAAFESLDFMVSLDIYLNETTRYATVILPGLSPLETCHYDMAFSQLAIHNYARYSSPVFCVPEGQQNEWETLLRLTGIFSGMGPNVDTAMMDDMVVMNVIERETALDTSLIHGRATDEIMKALEPRRGPERMLDFMLRTGSGGEGFGANESGLTLARLESEVHGVDLGPLQARLPEVLRTASGKIELAPELLLKDVPRLKEALTRKDDGLLLIGRRHLRSNNSWLHNIPSLVSGKTRCTLLIHPDDAKSHGLEDSAKVQVTSRVGSVVAPLEVTDSIMRGVVSLPHGWGHGQPGTRMSVAAANAGVNSNILTDEAAMDVPSGNSVLNGIPVTVAPAPAEEGADETAYAASK